MAPADVRPPTRARSGSSSSDCGAHAVSGRKGANACKAVATPVSFLASFAGVMVAARFALSAQLQLGMSSHTSPHTAIAVALLSSVAFILSSVLLLSFDATKRLGGKLMQRIMNTRQNWTHATLRSFVEVLVWFAVMWCTFDVTENIGFSIVCATVSGCLVVICGEYLSPAFADLERQIRRGENSSNSNVDIIAPGYIFVLSIYSHSMFSFIYENCTDIIVACVLAAAAGAAFYSAARLLVLWGPTYEVGNMLQARIFNWQENWAKNPIRSALESTCWFGTVLANYSVSGDLLLSLKIGTLAGILVCLSGEVCLAPVISKALARDEHARLGEVGAAPETSLLPVLVCGYALAISLYVISGSELHTGTSLLLSTLTGSLFVVAGQALIYFKPTRTLGRLLYDRVLFAPRNWRRYPLRSAWEACTWVLATHWTYVQTDSLVITIPAGTCAGAIAVVFSFLMGWSGPAAAAAAASSSSSSSAATAATTDKSDEDARAARKARRAANAKRVVTWEEVERHSDPSDCWIVIGDGVYDVTEWAPKHPGGSIIFKYAGRDATDQFAAFHKPRIYPRLRRLRVATLDAESAATRPVSPATQAYRDLRDRIWKAGLFDPDPAYYRRKHAEWAALIVVAAVLAITAPHIAASMSTGAMCCYAAFAGVFLGLGWQQAAFVAHDALHNGVTPDKLHRPGEFNLLGWFLGGPVFGISASMWTEEHNMHHAITLRPREDPQFDYLPLWLISLKEVATLPGGRLDAVTRKLVSVQHWTFLPLCTLIGRFNLYLISIFYSLKGLVTGGGSKKDSARVRYGALADIAGMAIFWVWVCFLVSQFSGTWVRVAFVLGSHWTVGILHIQLLLSHLATDTFTADEEAEIGFFRFQLATSRNIDCAHPIDNWFHGGLEYQIEHHLFPQLPRHNLGRVKPMVEEVCKAHGLHYESTGFFAALRTCLRDFERLAAAVVTLEQ